MDGVMSYGSGDPSYTECKTISQCSERANGCLEAQTCCSACNNTDEIREADFMQKILYSEDFLTAFERIPVQKAWPKGPLVRITATLLTDNVLGNLPCLWAEALMSMTI